MVDASRIHGVMRGTSPCADCTERFTACHDNCPKDKRADPKDPGYKMWLAQAQKIKEARNAYLADRHQAHEDDRRRNKWGITHS